MREQRVYRLEGTRARASDGKFATPLRRAQGAEIKTSASKKAVRKKG